jgi:hypothetical protein
MSAPNPIFVSPSTTFVQVDPLQSPYNPVILNTVVYPGQLVSIRDATSSFGVLETPIVVSTIINNSFSDGSISTLINQPQGFVTAQSYSTNKWAFLNSFPFRNQFVSAGVLNLNTSTLFTAVGSSLLEYVDSLTVENLTVTGNFVQSQGITLNTNVSSFGTVDFTSSLSVWDQVYLSSDMFVQGAAEFYSSLEVKDNFLAKSTLITLSSFIVSSVVSAIGSLSTPEVKLGDSFFGGATLDSLVGTHLEVQTSTFAFYVAGATYITSNLSTMGNLQVDGAIQTGTLFGYGDFLITNSASFYQTATVSSYTSTAQDVVIQGSLGVGGLLTVSGELFVQDSIFVNGDTYIQDILTVQSTLVTSTLTTDVLETFGDYANNSTIAQISSVFVDTNLGGRKVEANATGVGGTLDIGSNLNVDTFLTVTQDAQINQNVSSIAPATVAGEMMIEGGLSSIGGIVVSNLFSTMGTLTVLLDITTDYATVEGDVEGLGDLFVGGTLTISSIALPSSLVANDFTTGTLLVGTYAVVHDATLPSVKTSSMTVGFLPNTSYSFDLSGSLLLSTNPFPTPLSTSLLSTQLYQVGLNQTNSFVVTNAMGVGVEPQASSFVVNPLGYFLSSPVYVFSTLSTNVVVANTLQGAFFGDGSQLSNVQYPVDLSTFEIFVSQDVIVNTNLTNTVGITVNTLQTETFTNEGTLYALSTLTIGSFEIRGNVNCNTNAIEYNLTSNTLQTSPFYNLLTLNGINVFGSEIKRVVVNENYLSNVTGVQYNPPANLAVYNSLAVDGLPPSSRTNIGVFRGNTVIVKEAVGLTTETPIIPSYEGNLTILSGNISTTSGKFFLGEGEPYDGRFNIVQPYQSTLQFASTLFVNRYTSSVGINTQPNFALDSETIGVAAITALPDTLNHAEIGNLQPIGLPSTLFYAFVNSNATYLNTLYSSDGIDWKNDDTGVHIPRAYFTDGIYNLNTTGGGKGGLTTLPSIQQFFLGQRLVGGSTDGDIVRKIEQVFVGTQYPGFSFNAVGPSIFRSMATDGNLYLAVGTQETQTNTLFTVDLATDTIDVIPTDTNGSNIFPAWDSPISYPYGGYAITYGGLAAPYWVAVGAGKNGPMYTSVDGSSWILNNSGIFGFLTFEFRCVISVPLPNNGGSVFLTGGTFLFPSGNTYTPLNGFVFAATTPTSSWELSTSNFSGPVNALASDGQKVVAAVDGFYPNYSLWYSYITSNYLTSNNPGQWVRCSGDVFSDRANSVIWNGSLWISGGDSGIRHSLDGITWFNPNANLATEVLGLGYMSNAVTSLQVSGDFVGSNLLSFQDSPSLECQKILSVATVSYYPSANLNLNNALLFDSNQNVIVPGTVNRISPLTGTTFQSTFYAAASYVSSFLSTNKVVVGAYIQGVQNV